MARDVVLCEGSKLQRWKPLYRWGRIGASLGRSSEGFDKQGGISVNKLIRVVTTAFLAVLSTAGFIAVLSITVGLLTVLSAAGAADLPRKEPPPPAAARWASIRLENIQLANIRLANTHSPSCRKEEWPGWTPTEGEKRRLGPLPNYVEGGARNPMGARSLYLYAGGKDTLYRIHGTNQPAWIGHAISSGCIRLTNEDVIDLYSRVKVGALVVVLGPKQGLSRVASAL